MSRHFGIARAHKKVAFGEETMIRYIGCECVGLGAAVRLCFPRASWTTSFGWLYSWLMVGRLQGWIGLGRGGCGSRGSGGVEVMLRLRSNVERGMAAGCMQVGGLVVAVGVLRLRVLLGWILGLCLRLSCRLSRWVGCGGEVVVMSALIGCLGVGWGWVAGGGGILAAMVVIVSSLLMSVIVSTVPVLHHAHVRIPRRPG